MSPLRTTWSACFEFKGPNLINIPADNLASDPANAQRNEHVIITSKRRFDVIITCLLRCMFAGGFKVTHDIFKVSWVTNQFHDFPDQTTLFKTADENLSHSNWKAFIQLKFVKRVFRNEWFAHSRNIACFMLSLLLLSNVVQMSDIRCQINSSRPSDIDMRQ